MNKPFTSDAIEPADDPRLETSTTPAWSVSCDFNNMRRTQRNEQTHSFTNRTYFQRNLGKFTQNQAML